MHDTWRNRHIALIRRIDRPFERFAEQNFFRLVAYKQAVVVHHGHFIVRSGNYMVEYSARLKIRLQQLRSEFIIAGYRPFRIYVLGIRGRTRGCKQNCQCLSHRICDME